MSKFLEKRNAKHLEKEIRGRTAKGLISFFKQEIDTAYRAGMIHFDANDNTCIPPERIESITDRRSWHSVQDFRPTSPVKEEYLVQSYLNSKGYD